MPNQFGGKLNSLDFFHRYLRPLHLIKYFWTQTEFGKWHSWWNSKHSFVLVSRNSFLLKHSKNIIKALKKFYSLDGFEQTSFPNRTFRKVPPTKLCIKWKVHKYHMLSNLVQFVSVFFFRKDSILSETALFVSCTN